MSWYKNKKYDFYGYTKPDIDSFENAAAIYCLENKKTIRHYYPSTKLGKNKSELIKSLTEKYNFSVYSETYNDIKTSRLTKFVHDEAFVIVNNNEDLIFFSSFNDELFKELSSDINNYLEAKSLTNILTSDKNGLAITPIGNNGKKFSAENYNEEVVKKFDLICKELVSTDPKGKITILTGEPGTGKTNLIKSIIHECTSSKFIFIPPSLVPELVQPSFIKILIDYGAKNLVFILEDCDSCLTPRQSDNMSQISALLNLTDGLIGELLNIRLLCTTNASKLDIDKAILRHGRLSQMIEVGKLNKDSANNLYKKITNTDVAPFTEPTLLADIYACSKDIECLETMNKKGKKFGF